MADTTTASENETVQKQLIDSYPKPTGNYNVLAQNEQQSEYAVKNMNCLDISSDSGGGGDNLSVHSDCDILPNNNVCVNMGLSHCYTNIDCSSSIQKREMTSSNQVNLPYGESSSHASPSQECDTNLVHPADTTAKNESLTELRQNNLSSNIDEYDKEQSQNEEKSTEHSSSELSNGAIKKSNLSKSTNNRKKLNNLGSRSSTSRGRPRKALVAMYHSQISGDQNTIKIRIKKSNLTAQVQLPPNKKKSGRRKKHKINSDTDTSDQESKKKRSKSSTEILAESDVTSTQEPMEQSKWGNMPHDILHKIFQTLCMQEGCLPILVRLCQVCRLWRDVALSPLLWRTIDLNWVREKLRTDLKLHWLIQNRLMLCQDLNLGEWKVRNIQLALEALSEHCPELRGLTLSGWKGLNADHLKYLTTEFSKLERLDLSSINNASTSAMNAQPLVGLAQTMNSRLTHLVLAHNKLAGFTQIMAAIASNCPNLQLLDISNIRTFAHNTALLHVEKLQIGCPKLRVLRITNSQIWLAPISLSNQVASPGFPMLEELSVAGIEDDHITARSIDDDGVDRILKTSNKLRLLDVRGCIRLTDSGLVRVPAWDLEHLFLSSCYVTRTQNAGLELILQKWSHSLLEVDLAWSTATSSLDAAVMVLAEKGNDSRLRVLNLCGSSVSLEPVKAVLVNCPKLHSINLQSCRALPRGIKRLYTGEAVTELRHSLQAKPKTDEDETDMEQTSSDKLASV